MDSLMNLIGKQLIETNGVQALDDNQVGTVTVEMLAKAEGLSEVRYCSLSGFTDMEYRENRVKITTDNDGVICHVCQG